MIGMADRVPSKTVAVVLATAIPSAVVTLAVLLCCRARRRPSRPRLLFGRGITPIDEEIESWKTGGGGDVSTPARALHRLGA